jgi:hypothetical protein
VYTSLVPATTTVCPVSTTYIRQHSRVTSTFDDNLIDQYAIVATEMVESYLSRYLLTRQATWTVSENHNARGHALSMIPWQWSSFVANPVFDLPRPCQSVISVSVGIWDQTDILLVEDRDYQLDLTGLVGRLRWISNAFLNPLRDHLQIVLTSGYGAVADVPTPIIHAITLLTTNLYTNRGDQPSEIWSPALESLLAQYRFVFFG